MTYLCWDPMLPCQIAQSILWAALSCRNTVCGPESIAAEFRPSTLVPVQGPYCTEAQKQLRHSWTCLPASHSDCCFFLVIEVTMDQDSKLLTTLLLPDTYAQMQMCGKSPLSTGEDSMEFPHT